MTSHAGHMARRKRTKIERQLGQMLKPPAGFEMGTPNVKVTAEMSMYPKIPKPSSSPAAGRAYKPKPMPVRIVGMVEKARLGRR